MSLLVVVLELLGLTLFLIGSLMGIGILIFYYPDVGIFLSTTYLCYFSSVTNIILTLSGSMIISSVIIIGIKHLSRMWLITSIFFLGLTMVNIVRFITIPPDWSIPGSGFEFNMLYQYEGLTVLSFIVLMCSLMAYCLSIALELPKGVLRYLSIIVAIIWSILVINMIAGIPFIGADLDTGLSRLFRWIGILMIFPIILTGGITLEHRHHFIRLQKNEIL